MLLLRHVANDCKSGHDWTVAVSFWGCLVHVSLSLSPWSLRVMCTHVFSTPVFSVREAVRSEDPSRLTLALVILSALCSLLLWELTPSFPGGRAWKLAPNGHGVFWSSLTLPHPKTTDRVCHLWAYWTHTVMTPGKVLVLSRISGAPKAAVVLLSYLLSVEFELPMSPKFASRRELFFSFCLAVGQQVDIQSYCSKWESVKTICESALVVVFLGFFFFFSEQKLCYSHQK